MGCKVVLGDICSFIPNSLFILDILTSFFQFFFLKSGLLPKSDLSVLLNKKRNLSLVVL